MAQAQTLAAKVSHFFRGSEDVQYRSKTGWVAAKVQRVHRNGEVTVMIMTRLQRVSTGKLRKSQLRIQPAPAPSSPPAPPSAIDSSRRPGCACRSTVDCGLRSCQGLRRRATSARAQSSDAVPMTRVRAATTPATPGRPAAPCGAQLPRQHQQRITAAAPMLYDNVVALGGGRTAMLQEPVVLQLGDQDLECRSSRSVCACQSVLDCGKDCRGVLVPAQPARPTHTASTVPSATRRSAAACRAAAAPTYDAVRLFETVGPPAKTNVSIEQATGQPRHRKMTRNRFNEAKARGEIPGQTLVRLG